MLDALNVVEYAVSVTHNHFPYGEPLHGSFTISDGSLTVEGLKNGQYFEIVGSALNDGIYKYPSQTMTDETFTGMVQPMAIPKEILGLADEITAFEATHPVNDKTSESFGGYSYSKATNANGVPVSWQDVFKQRFLKWRLPCG